MAGVVISKSPSDSDPDGICTTINRACGAAFINLEKKIDKLIEAIEGNGKPGLRMEVHDMQMKCAAVQQEKEKSAKSSSLAWNKYASPIYNVVVVAILTVFISGVVVFFQQKSEDSRVAKLDTIMQELKAMEKVK